MTELSTQRNRAARALFAPLATTYDRYARLLSFGQDPRWRSFLVSRLEAGPTDSVLDVACGTGAVAIELVRRYGCRVTGVDQSPEMLDSARPRLGNRVELVEARAEALPFEDATYDGLTFTYLLRYVDDPAATMRELRSPWRACRHARVLRPGKPGCPRFLGGLCQSRAADSRQADLPWVERGRNISRAEHPRFLAALASRTAARSLA